MGIRSSKRERADPRRPPWQGRGARDLSSRPRVGQGLCLTQIQRHLGPSYGNPLVGPTPEAVVALIWRAKGQEVDVLCSPPKARYVVLTDNLVTEQGEVDDFGIFALEVLKRLHL